LAAILPNGPQVPFEEVWFRQSSLRSHLLECRIWGPSVNTSAFVGTNQTGGLITSGLPVILPKCTNGSPHFPTIRPRDLRPYVSDCLLDFHDRIVIRLARREVHLFTRQQAITFWPVNFEVARLNLVDLDAADVGSDT
jgi:hypothetical protein